MECEDAKLLNTSTLPKSCIGGPETGGVGFRLPPAIKHPTSSFRLARPFRFSVHFDSVLPLSDSGSLLFRLGLVCFPIRAVPVSQGIF